jgi:hypothetical protein
MARALLVLVTLACGIAAGWYGREVWSRFSAFAPVAAASPIPVTIVTAQPRPQATGPAAVQKPGAGVPLPLPKATPLVASPNDPPAILGVALSSPVAIGGQVITGTVKTSSNVASVEARIAGYSASLNKVGVGVFALAYKVPELPAFLRRTYSVQLIARNPRGDSTSSSFPLTVR